MPLKSTLRLSSSHMTHPSDHRSTAAVYAARASSPPKPPSASTRATGTSSSGAVWKDPQIQYEQLEPIKTVVESRNVLGLRVFLHQRVATCVAHCITFVRERTTVQLCGVEHRGSFYRRPPLRGKHRRPSARVRLTSITRGRRRSTEQQGRAVFRQRRRQPRGALRYRRPQLLRLGRLLRDSLPAGEGTSLAPGLGMLLVVEPAGSAASGQLVRQGILVWSARKV